MSKPPRLCDRCLNYRDNQEDDCQVCKKWDEDDPCESCESLRAEIITLNQQIVDMKSCFNCENCIDDSCWKPTEDDCEDHSQWKLEASDD